MTSREILHRLFVASADIEQAFLQLQILLKGDVPVASALETVATLRKGYLAEDLNAVAAGVRSGRSLAHSLETEMPYLAAIYRGLVKVGESNGSLPLMFTYAAEMMARRREIRSQIVRAMSYPLVVVFMGLGVGYYVSTVAIPKIISVMGDASSLPPITRSLLTTSDYLQHRGFLLFLIPAAIVFALSALRRIPSAAIVLDRLAVALPIFGKVGRYSANTLFNRTFALLLRSGISVVDGLELIEGTLANGWYRREIGRVRQAVTEGTMLSKALDASGLKAMTPLTPALVRVGENSGNMDEGLIYAGEYYRSALEKRLELLGKLVEPALIVVVGGMVAYVYMAFFMGMAAMNVAQ